MNFVILNSSHLSPETAPWVVLVVRVN